MRPALEVADIFRRHGEAFRAAQGGRLLPDQRRVMAAIAACRTATLGGHVERCDDCGMARVLAGRAGETVAGSILRHQLPSGKIDHSFRQAAPFDADRIAARLGRGHRFRRYRAAVQARASAPSKPGRQRVEGRTSFVNLSTGRRY
jgi:hypothetical protein